MGPIPLTLQTLYADLVQQVHSAPAERGTVYRQTVKGIEYLYVRTTVGAVRRDRFLGRADDPAVQARAETARNEARRAAERRNTVRILRAQGVPGPAAELGRVLDALADAGLFKEAVLVGTAAYQCYSPIVGAALPAAALMTRDADLATATLALASDEGAETLEIILKRADPTFGPIPGLSRKAPPSHFRSA
ncbi:MAG TPA: GSU2403 family nucleotidyltransferase fold protein, partial [Propylenella sp.]